MAENYRKVYLYKRVVQAKLFMDTRYSEIIDLSYIADEAYFSKFHFIRLFKSIYGKTPHQYLTRVRIEAAKELLQKEMSVAETCFTVGFESLSSFTGLFKRYTKTSPSEYQRQYKIRKDEIKEVPLQFIPNCFAEKKDWT